MKRSYLKQSLLFVFILISSIATAQHELKNKVVDFINLLPIESASVYVQNTTIGTVTNADGKFVLLVPETMSKDTLVISSIGFKSFKVPVEEFDNSFEVFLEEDIATLEEVVLNATPRPKTGDSIVLRALDRLDRNMPNQAYLQKGFLRHKERNKKEFKWLVESAITIYDDSTYVNGDVDNIKINVDEVRKSYDLRDVDSLFAYSTYLKYNANVNLKPKNLRRDTINTSSLVKAIKWNDTRVNGLENLFKGKLNMVRNSKAPKALFGKDVLAKHKFILDTILVDNERKIYKIKIDKAEDFVGLDTEGIYNEGYNAKGWIYIYWDNFAIKKIEYDLVAASAAQKTRSKRLFDTQTNHKLVISYMEYQDKMYPNYIYYETPKLVNVGLKNEKLTEEEQERYNKEERFYYTVQEILFTEVIVDQDKVEQSLTQQWDPDIFAKKPYHKSFWDNYNTLLESEEDEQLIKDLTKRSSLFNKE
ncbi:TonB-dependent receptor [Mesoflavibacter sp. HG96]|uniref:carboxypeptidase-like regulatory domain-containing protein n=1 Tax=unclassified Mesoflavibacter TaxID=2630131 RepID=UPI000D0F7A2A|nr:MULTISPECIES: carboxypeptidase-like regulatory domain-containing protein [unclassified Mesoflavibacter]QIJ88085.1 TonB-dependent receptor [Mesoflavibacter sp. HG96]QIJ90813.1 TonB-dependent receptor [Mesoflavibacter sp. HG37]